jgi:ABC-type antimicrobial peptide transport system permease subunit
MVGRRVGHFLHDAGVAGLPQARELRGDLGMPVHGGSSVLERDDRVDPGRAPGGDPARNYRDEHQLRTARDTQSIAPAIREALQAVNPKLFTGITSVGEAINKNIAKERMVAAISAFFGLLGLSLACMGLFGVASSTVTQRTNELGIRMALGADRWSVVREALRDTMLVFGAGLTAGVIAAILAVRVTASFIADLLFGLTPTDATNMAGAVLVMIGVAWAACILPARRATRIDPLAAIRHE